MGGKEKGSEIKGGGRAERDHGRMSVKERGVRKEGGEKKVARGRKEAREKGRE